MLQHREIGPVGAALLLFFAVVVADRSTGDETVFVSLLITAPLLVAAFARPVVTAAVGLAATGLAVLLAPMTVSSPNQIIRLVAIVAGSSLAVLVSARRESRERALLDMTVVADVAQNAVLWPVPRRVAGLELAARYVSASSAARIGGDLYEVVETEHGVRAIMGDVRGKGLPAVRLASAVLGCFREVAHTRADLEGVHEALDATVRRIASPEDFVTAVLLEVDGDRLRVLSCGHPPPLLVSGGTVTALTVDAPGLPLGLGGAGEAVGFPFPAGARLLLHTDGLLEGRDADGTFFPTEEHVARLCSGTVDACLDDLLGRLRDHCGGHIDDDVALLVLHRDAS